MRDFQKLPPPQNQPLSQNLQTVEHHRICGIRVNAVGPGAIVTPIDMAWINDDKARVEVEIRIPMGRARAAEESPP